jgi:hypothetical protein
VRRVTVQAVRRRLGRGARWGVRTLRKIRWRLQSAMVSRRRTSNPITDENAKPGSGWAAPADAGIQYSDDLNPRIKAYAGATSVALGDALDFFVDVPGGEDYEISVFRIGYYRGKGSRLVTTSPKLRGLAQKAPEIDPVTRRISCAWDPSWRLEVPAEWTSGYYLGVLTTADGWRTVVPFVVRDEQRRADLCVVIPFTTYQAYNQWPLDGVTGRSLYYGYDTDSGEPGAHPLAADRRAFAVSFDRPYSRDGMPKLADLDMSFVYWAEAAGYDLSYATSHDLHAGRVDPRRHAALVFSGHDEYWSPEMRRAGEAALAAGTSLAFLSANNVYWHIRFEPDDDRTMVCYKSEPDPNPSLVGATGRWRDPAPDPGNPEQRMLGVMYNGIVARPAPLVVVNPEHWFWAGTGVKRGTRIPRLVSGEGDGVVSSVTDGPSGRVLLSASPFQLRTGANRVQNTVICEPSRNRAMIFVAGALHWSWALGLPDKTNTIVQRATANVLDHMIGKAAKRR